MKVIKKVNPKSSHHKENMVFFYIILWVFAKLIVVIKSLCCAVNSYSAVCQFYLSKTGRKKKRKE